jgi:para-nitrobenzyl esterase
MAKKWCAVQNTPSYLWMFERNLPGDNHGAWHSSDLWYWFGTLDNCWRPMEEKDYALSAEMTDRLCAFAMNGNPNAADYAEWRADGKTALIFGDNAAVQGKPSRAKLWLTMFTNKAPGE